MEGKKNWLELPDDIASEIAIRLCSDVDDLVRFGAVCKLWRYMVVDVSKRYPPTPWLMLPENKQEDDDDDVITTNNKKEEVRKFYCLSTKRVFYNYLPEAVGKRCYGSQFGWLLTIDLDGNMNLLNPLNRCHVPLPSPLTFLCQDYTVQEPPIQRVCLVTHFAMSSTNICDDNCVVMVIYSHSWSIAFARPGDQSWTAVSGPKRAHMDVTFFNAKFYAISAQGILRLCDIHTPHPKLIDILPKPDDVGYIDYMYVYYLVEMSGNLHLVVRYYDDDENAPQGISRHVDKLFDVYKLDFEANEWIELIDLGEYAIFVGNHTSFSVSTLDHPQLKANSVYFTDDHCDCYPDGISEGCDGEEYYRNGHGGGGRAMGIYDFEEETIEPFYMGTDILSTFCPPLFFTPSLI